ncbi:MAG: MBOAT family protein [Actinobacteria bacterium]|nr:MBOAT family protein [Actinomycetota bacterium]
MLFPTVQFAIFFAIVLPTSWLLAHRRIPWSVFIIVASYVFYGAWDWRFVFLLAGSTVANQLVATGIHRSRTQASRNAALWVGVALNLGVLAWFKYYDFFVNSSNSLFDTLGLHTQLPLRQLVLPVGLSFITFQALSYVIDTWRGRIEPTNFLDFAVYLSFFPHLVAGPIVRAGEFLPQLRKRLDPRRVDAGLGFWLIASGLFKKVVISSYVSSTIVDPVFGFPNQHGALDTLFGIYGYAIQIYADFSGYTDIAIGVALLLGFRFPQNFDAPYSAASLQEFWRRWHMTLSRWLRDYLYIPLGGNRRGRARGYANLAITMLLGGLWHGAAWTFVVWGGLHGLGLAAERWHADRIKARPPAPEPTPARRTWHLVWTRLATFHFVCLCWVFFRATSFANAFTVLGRLFHFGGNEPLNLVLIAVIAGAIAVQFLPSNLSGRIRSAFSYSPWWAQAVLLACAVVTINALGPTGVAPFIYFQF